MKESTRIFKKEWEKFEKNEREKRNQDLTQYIIKNKKAVEEKKKKSKEMRIENNKRLRRNKNKKC